MTSSNDPNTPETDNPRDDEENTGISAGYTYLGQFIDHDLTFDPSTLAQQKSDPDAIIDFRTPGLTWSIYMAEVLTISLTYMIFKKTELLKCYWESP